MKKDNNSYTDPQKPKRKKYVAKFTKTGLQKYWGIPVPYPWPDILYVRCTKDGKVNDWGKAPVYYPSEIIKDKFEVVPFYETTECMCGCGREFDVRKGPFQKGETVFTIYNRIPGILKCEVYTCELGKVGLIVKQILTIEKDENAEIKLETYLNDLLFTADENNVFRDLEQVYERINDELS